MTAQLCTVVLGFSRNQWYKHCRHRLPDQTMNCTVYVYKYSLSSSVWSPLCAWLSSYLITIPSVYVASHIWNIIAGICKCIFHSLYKTLIIWISILLLSLFPVKTWNFKNWVETCRWWRLYGDRLQGDKTLTGDININSTPPWIWAQTGPWVITGHVSIHNKLWPDITYLDLSAPCRWKVLTDLKYSPMYPNMTRT